MVKNGVMMMKRLNQFKPAQKRMGIIRAKNTNAVPRSGCRAIKRNGINISKIVIIKYLSLLSKFVK